MVAFYKHDIARWMDGTEALSADAYRAYHVVLQLIYLNEGPIVLNERGIAGRCNQSIRSFRIAMDELLASGKLHLADGKIDNPRAQKELDSVYQNRKNAAKGGRSQKKVCEKSREVAETSSGQHIDGPRPLENNDLLEASLEGDVSLIDKRREEKKPPLSPPGGEGGKSRSNKGARIDPDWQPSESLVAFARSLGFAQDAWKSVRDEFVDYWRGVAGPKSVKLDWDATFRNWLRTTAERRGVRPAAPTDGARPDGWPTRIQQDPDGVYRLWKNGIWPPSLGPPVGDPNCWIPKQFVDEWQERARQDRADVSNSRH